MSNESKARLNHAVSLQAANLAQKLIIDNMATKLIRVLKAVKSYQAKPVIESAHDTLLEIAEAVSMDRNDAAGFRSEHLKAYPDERIQAAINEAVDKVAAILLEDVG